MYDIFIFYYVHKTLWRNMYDILYFAMCTQLCEGICTIFLYFTMCTQVCERNMYDIFILCYVYTSLWRNMYVIFIFCFVHTTLWRDLYDVFIFCYVHTTLLRNMYDIFIFCYVHTTYVIRYFQLMKCLILYFESIFPIYGWPVNTRISSPFNLCFVNAVHNCSFNTDRPRYARRVCGGLNRIKSCGGHCVKEYWIRPEKYSVFVRIKTRIAIIDSVYFRIRTGSPYTEVYGVYYGNTSLNTDEYGALLSPYSVVFYVVGLN